MAPPYRAAVLEVLLPRRCALCARTGDGVCAACAATLTPAPDVAPPPGLDAAWALLSYDEVTARLVAEIKFRNHRDALDAVGRALATVVRGSAGSPGGPVDVVTWAPTSPERRRSRGYDQAELLARSVARHAGSALRGTLRRRSGSPQTGADRVHRLLGPSFDPLRPVRGHAVVVDDVWTTGATLAAGARALREAGADRITGLVLAVRP